MVFRQPGAVGKLSVDRACIAYCEETADGLTLAVSDPTHESSTFHLVIDEPLAPTQLPPEVESSVVKGKTVLTYHAENGRNYLARLSRR